MATTLTPITPASLARPAAPSARQLPTALPAPVCPLQMVTAHVHALKKHTSRLLPTGSDTVQLVETTVSSVWT